MKANPFLAINANLNPPVRCLETACAARLLSLLLLVLPVVTQAQYTCTTNDDGTITIAGYTGSDDIVAIPDTINDRTVTGIGVWVFSGNTNLTSITIPDSVTNLGDCVFYQCSSLTNVTLSKNLISIGNYTFQECAALTNVTIPESVISIGDGAFIYCIGLINVTIPASVTSIGEDAFCSCSNLRGIYFKGNVSDSFNPIAFEYDNNATVYYMPGAAGWDTTYHGLPTALWNPQVQNDASFGMQANQFGFNITGDSGLIVVVEACTNLANPVWSPQQTITLTGQSFYFGDSTQTNYPSRFYHLRMP